jgi:hypothetical protein
MNIKSIRPIIIDTRADKIKSNIKILENTLDILNNIPTINISRPILYTSRELYHKDIDYYKINELKSLNEYSKFCIKFGNIWPDDAYALFCQHDGYPININCWDDRFLDYDYIGSPWGTDRPDYKRVGNGGFSLRSAKLLKIVSNIIPPYDWPEDLMICDIFGDVLQNEYGIKFAPIDLAIKFSYEVDIPERTTKLNESFGFHDFKCGPIKDKEKYRISI